MKRLLSIWLPHLAIERWTKSSDSPPDSPVVLTVEGTHGPVIHAATQAAVERGARAGARLVDARALDPALIAVPADPAGDDALVHRLARWAARWSPLVEADGDGLKLDVTGVAHLFGGEAGLVDDVQSRFAALGLTSRTAIAPTQGAAWALSHYGDGPALRCGTGVAAALAPLPVAALRLSRQATQTLERLGLKTIAALSGIERRSLARRFRATDNPIDALDRLLGRKADPLTAIQADAPSRALLRLAEPVADPSAAAQALELLVPRLVKELEQRRLGARRLALTGFRVDGSTATASVATAIASRDPKHLKRLLADRAAALDPGFGFDGFALEACVAEPLGAAQDSLVEQPDGQGDLARLVDRLSVKLGGAVRLPCARESHLPERASGWVTAVEGSSSSRGAQRRGNPQLDCFASLAMTVRPQRLLDRPEAIDVIYATPEGMPRRFVWRRAVHDIARAEGPERIAPEWWRERSSARLRDYYRVEDASGRRYWIFREGLAGDGRGGAPAWFIHGLFG